MVKDTSKDSTKPTGEEPTKVVKDTKDAKDKPLTEEEKKKQEEEEDLVGIAKLSWCYVPESL